MAIELGYSIEDVTTMAAEGVLYAEGAVSRLSDVHGTKSSRGKVA